MNAGQEATSVGDVQLPVELVELSSRALRRKDGTPVVVRCEFIEEGRILEIAKAPPGEVPELGPKQKVSNVEKAARLLRYAGPIIEAGCSLKRADGTWLRPAFYFGEADPGTGALPGRFLSDGDKLRLFGTCMRLSGYVGGAAASVRFHGDRRKRGTAGKRAVGARRRNRNKA